MTELYTFDFCLKRLFKQAEQQQLQKKKKPAFKKPTIYRQNLKTLVDNFSGLCDWLNRDENSVKSFIDSRLHTTSSIKSIKNSDNKMLSIDNLFTESDIINVIDEYARIYVICQEPKCKSLDTEIIKEKSILYLKCNVCNSSKSIG
jgi:translation initiation factor 2 subunit 2